VIEQPFPLPLSAYPSPLSGRLIDALWLRLVADPFNGIATAIFVLAVLHTFVAARFTEAAHHVQERRDAAAVAAGLPPVPSVAAELLHFLGEVEVVFGLWIFQLVAEEKSNKDIAGLLFISPSAVERHRARIMEKLDLHSASTRDRRAPERSDLVTESGLVTDEYRA